MFEDERFRKFHPSAIKLFKITSEIGIAVYDNYSVVFIYTLKRVAQYQPPVVTICKDVWWITDTKKILILPCETVVNRGTGVLRDIGYHVAGKFRKTKDIIHYEYQDMKYEIPYVKKIEFINNVPVGIEGKKIVSRGPMPRTEKTSDW